MQRGVIKWCGPIALLAVGMLLATAAARAEIVDFEDLSLAPESQWDGVDTTYDNGSGDLNQFHSRGATFNNYHEWSDPWGFGETHYWECWAYSNRTDTGSTGPAGQYTAMADPAGGQGSSDNYGVAYVGWYGGVPTVGFTTPTLVQGAYFTNSAYAYHSMLTGDSFARKFGWKDSNEDGDYDDPGDYAGNYPDWFLLSITGKDASGSPTGPVLFYLADFQSDNDQDDYIIADWTWQDLSSLGPVTSLEFGLTSSDTGAYGINTPTFFAMDSLVVVPEPSTMAMIACGVLCTMLYWRRRAT